MLGKTSLLKKKKKKAGNICSNRFSILTHTCVVVHSIDAIFSREHILKLRKKNAYFNS